MRKLKSEAWLLSLATMLGMASSTYAQDQFAQQADAIFGATDPALIQQISNESCGPAGCDVTCDPSLTNACDSTGCGSTYLFGGDEAWDLGSKMFAEDSGWDIGGWTSWGFSTANDGVFATYPGHFQNNQTNLFVEKVADGSNGIGFGGRVDVMYGTDASNTQSFGNSYGVFDFHNNYGVYDWAIPQLYAEVAYGDLSVKIGHFYTLLGYQVVPATGNFFYSIPYTFNFGEAFTHTGALATYKASDNLTLYGGYTFGWDTGFDQINGGSSFLGGASVGVTDDVTVTYILTAGNLGWIGNGYSHSIVVDYVINDKWEYVFQTDLDSMNNSINSRSGDGHYSAVGVNQYLFYTVSDTTKLGARVEWWKANGQSLCEMAYGVNWKPMANLTLRPEVRYNWAPGGGVQGGPGSFTLGPLPTANPNATTGNAYNSNCIFMMDAVLTF